MGLSGKKRAFAEYWLIGAGRNGSEAARLAGYSPHTAGQQAYRLLHDPEVQAYITERESEMEMEADEVIRRMTDQSRASMADFIKLDANGEPILDLRKAQRLGKLHLIKKISYDSRGKPQIELYSAQEATRDLGRIRGLYLDRVKTGDDEEPLDLEEWRAKRQQRLDAVRSLPSKPDDSESEIE